MDTPRKILLIEDDSVSGNLYKDMLQSHGYEVRMAADGENARAMLLYSVPDLILLDLLLPKMSGLEVLKLVRQLKFSRDVPVIVFSSAVPGSLGTEALEAGADKCLSKADCTPERMLEVIRALLENPRSAPAATPASDSVAETQPVIPAASSNPGSASEGSALASSRLPTGSTVQLAQVDPSSESMEQISIEALRGEIRHAFLQTAPPKVSALRPRLLELINKKDADWPAFLADLHVVVRPLTANAELAGLERISRLSKAMAALTQELVEEPETLNMSSQRTVAQGLDFLITLFQEANQQTEKPVGRSRVLVVDDEPICRLSAAAALESADLTTLSFEDPLLALRVLAENRFDLVVTDVDMPGKNGFELCGELRAMRTNTNTPVILLTGLTDLQSRARSALSGADEFIAKPFAPAQLAVKALTLVLKPRAKKK